MNISNNNKFMRWTMRLLLLAFGMVLGITVLIGGALLYLDDEDYRQLLIRGTDRFLDARLEINGPFSLAIGQNLLLTAGNVRLTANDGSYTFEAGEIDLSQRLGSWVLTGTSWINHLTLGDVQLYLLQGDERGFSPEDWRLPPVVIQEARLDNVHIVYEERGKDRKHEVSLLHLKIDDINDSGPVGVSGEGLVNGMPVSLDGRLDPVAELADTREPYAIELDLQAAHLTLHLAGSILDPVRGTGMGLQVIFEDEAISDTIRQFDRNIPDIGALTAGFGISGDYVSPALHDIDLHLTRDGAVELQVTGDVSDVLTGQGLALEIEGRSDDLQVLSWALFEKQDHVESFSFKGRVLEEQGNFLLRAVDARTRTRPGLEMHLTGNTRLPTRAEPRPSTGEAFTLKLTSPGIAALNLPEFGKLPEFGRVVGTARVRPYLDGMGYFDIRLETGTEEQVHAMASGSFAFVPYRYDKGMSGIDLDVKLRAVDSAALGKAIHVGLPELGAVRLGMQVSGDSSKLAVDNISLETGLPDQPVLRINGNLQTGLRKHTSTMTATFEVAVADIAAALREVPTGYLGRIEGSFGMSDIDGSWGLDRFDVSSKETDLYRLHIHGALDDVTRRDTAEINVEAEIQDPAAFGRAADISLSGISPYRMNGVLRFDNDRLHYSGSASIGRSHSQTELSGRMADGRPDLKGKLVVPVLYLDDIGIPPGSADERINTDAREPEHRAHAFSREPFSLHALGLLDLDIDIRVDSIDSGGKSAARQATGKILLQDRVLHIAPMRLVADGGPTDMELKIDARDVPAMSLKVSADDQTLGPWLAQVQGTIPVEGFASYRYYLAGRGHSPHELASGLDGKISLALENAKVPMHFVEYLSADVLGWTLGKLVKGEKYANLNCVLADFDIRDGVMSSTLLAADGPRLAIEADVTIDLGAETINAVFLPKQKRKVFSSMSPVRLSGDMRAPDVKAIPTKEAAGQIGALVLVPYVAIPVAVFGKLWESVDDHDAYGGGCANLHLEKARESAGRHDVKSPDYSWYME